MKVNAEGMKMKIEMTAEQARLTRFALQILLDDETTEAADRKNLAKVADRIDLAS